jgi:hypothetical protein
MTIWPSAEGLLRQTIRAITLSRWILALAVMGAGLASLTVASHVRGATAPIEHARIIPTIKAIAPPGAKSTDAATTPSAAQQVPPFSDVRFRFGFLEFEDDGDAPST